MTNLNILPQDPVLVNLIAGLNSIGSMGGLRQTERALGMITDNISRAWQESVGPKHTIERNQISPFTHIIKTKDQMVLWLEFGLVRFDMKYTHTKGKRSRRVKARRLGNKLITRWNATRKDGSRYTVNAGDPYLIIPFRHDTRHDPGKDAKGARKGKKTLTDMYSKVQKQMKADDFMRTKVEVSADNSNVKTPNYWYDAIGRAQYSRGTTFSFPEGKEYQHLRGMIATGDSKQSSFMTFRIVSVNSPRTSWIHPGIAAKRYLHNILEESQESIRNIIKDALKKDIGQ